MPRDLPLPDMTEDEILDYLLSLQPERQREMTHAPRRDPKFTGSRVPYTDWRTSMPGGHTVDDVGNYISELSNAPLPALYTSRDGRPRASLDRVVPPELRRFLRLPVNAALDVTNFLKPETPSDVALMATGVYGPAAGVALKSIKRGYKEGLKTRGWRPEDRIPGWTEKRGTRELQAGILTDIARDAKNSLEGEDD